MAIDLASKTMLIFLSISAWSGGKLDKDSTAEIIASKGAKDGHLRVWKSLVDSESLKAVEKARGNARTYHYKMTLPWADSGYRILPAANYLKYIEAMRAFKNDYENSVLEFLGDYQQAVRVARTNLGSAFDSSDYPPISRIERKFAFSTSVMPLPQAPDFRVNLQSDEIERIRTDIESRINTTADMAIRDLLTRDGGIVDCVSTMVERLSKFEVTAEGKRKNRFADTLVENIRDLVERLPGLNFTDDPRIASLVSQMQDRLCVYDPETLREDETVRMEVLESAKTIMESMQDCY
jgi:hypothetical protein